MTIQSNINDKVTSGVKLTPMFEQYLGIKNDYPDALLFYRMGDFYELFFEDAVTTARELQLTLTSRNPNSEDPVPMCGVPHHAVESYIPNLLAKGYKVVICDQLENPKDAKGLVKRGVTKVLTPGTVIEDSSLTQKEHNFLGALFWDKDTKCGGFAWVDNSTGTWTGLCLSKKNELIQWVEKISPRELLVADDSSDRYELVKNTLYENTQVLPVPFSTFFSLKRSEDRLLKNQGVKDLESLGLAKKPELVMACGALLLYLEQTQKAEMSHLGPFSPISLNNILIIDEVTERNLEIFKTFDGRKGAGTLWHSLDETITPMGGRLLAERLKQPWRTLPPIIETQAVVEHCVKYPDLLDKLRVNLKRIYDIERLSTRIFLNRSAPKDFGALKQSLLALPDLLTSLISVNSFNGVYPDSDDLNGNNLPLPLFNLLKSWDSLDDISDLLEKALAEELPQQVTSGGLFRMGYNKELDELINLSEHAELLLQELLQKEQEKSSLPKLKLGYNRVFGYYFEVSRLQSTSLPEYFVRRQTLANAERFITPELKELEEKIFEATDKRNALEYNLFMQLREIVASARRRFTLMSQIVATIDFWQSLSYSAIKNQWVKPTVHSGYNVKIRQGRHPVIEKIQGKGNFVPNDLYMDERRRMILITGPNMSGKSTILRQTAILFILAQIGSFVPAAEAEIGLSDRIFSRVGASDNLAQGQSTFMVEMMETARILRQSTKASLVILDEIGRGTSTYDGLALAWAIVEDLVARSGGTVRTLFATHYHELTVLEGKLPGVHNMNVAIREWNGELVFLRKLVPGPTDKSYGIEVAKLAGVPNAIVQRASQILAGFVKKCVNSSNKTSLTNSLQLLPDFEERKTTSKPVVLTEEPPLRHPFLIVLDDLEIESLSPMKAFELIQDWKMLWGKENK